MILGFIESVASVANYIFPVLIVLGVVFCIVEAVIPGFGVFGILGILSFVGGIVVFAFKYSATYVVILVASIIVFFCFICFVMVNASKTGKNPLFEGKTSLPVDYDLNTMVDNSKYINKFGQVIADCKPVGKAIIDNDVIVVIAKRNYITKDTMIKVIEVNDDKIIVDIAE